ncbi:MAG: ornithine cyclodeaminase family protein, partial [Planctomycetes bacterium]|nr:ornithine cyclodeaminase family protein [Planctomycetota bacterium]
LILNDPETGLPLSVMDAVWITAKRTGAATALAAKYLARRDSSSLGVLGAGVQGFSNLEALEALFPLEKVVVYDVVSEQMEQYRSKVTERWPGIKVVQAKEPREAVSGLDLVVTAGPILRKPHATIKAGWLSEGAFASMVDFDSYWHGDALREADKFVTDDISQLEHYREIGYFQDIPSIYADLGDLASGKKKGRERDEQRTITCNLGLAINDMATAILVYRRAVERKIGTWLPL